MLAHWIGAPMEEIEYVCGGINHLAWYVKYEWNGEDAYPLIRKAMKRPKVYNEEKVRNEMFLALGYYVTESSGHNSEYNWWFRKRQDIIDEISTSTGWNPGEYAYILHEYQRAGREWKKWITSWLDDPKPLNLARGHEYAASIINAWLGGDTFRFNGNVPNTHLITNLPENCCVEVPVFAEKGRLNPVHVGALPPACQPLNAISVAVEELAVEAALTGSPEKVFHACCYDPLCAAVLSLKEIRDMVQTMLKKNLPHLPQFSSHKW